MSALAGTGITAKELKRLAGVLAPRIDAGCYTVSEIHFSGRPVPLVGFAPISVRRRALSTN
jgi:hypothetical protein